MLCQSHNAIDKVLQVPDLQNQFDAGNKFKQQNMTWELVSNCDQQSKESVKAMFGNIQLMPSPTMPPGKISLGEPIIKVPLQYRGACFVAGMVVIGDYLAVVYTTKMHIFGFMTWRVATPKQSKLLESKILEA